MHLVISRCDGTLPRDEKFITGSIRIMKKSPFALLAFLALAGAQLTHAAEMKWHPGHYLVLNDGDSLSKDLTNINEIAGVPAIKGVEVKLWWSELERSRGVYDFSQIDAYLKKLKSLPTPKRLVIRVMDRRFKTTSKSNIVPNYLLTESIYHGGVTLQRTNSSGYVARLWEAPVMDRLIALYRALAERYDDDSYVEGIASEETTLSLGSDPRLWPSGYSSAALLNQYERLVSSATQFMTHTSLFLGTNYIGTVDQMATLIQRMDEVQVAARGSNTVPTRLSHAQRVWTGQTGADYRNNLAIANAIESLELGGSHGSYTPKQLYDYAYKTLYVSYLFWPRNTWSGNSSQRWSTGILPFLKTNPPTRTGCPSSYGLCKTN